MHLIIFDIDGTLVDSNHFDSELYIESVRNTIDIAIDANWSQYKNVTDSGILDQIIDEHNLHSSRSDIHSKVRCDFIQKTKDYIQKKSGKLKEIPGAKYLIETLQTKRNVALAVATGGWKETAELKLRRIGINPDTLPLASASDSPSRIEIIQIAAKRALNGRPVFSKTYFGDGIWDKMAGRQLNYQFIAVGNSVEHSLNVADFHDVNSIFSKINI